MNYLILLQYLSYVPHDMILFWILMSDFNWIIPMPQEQKFRSPYHDIMFFFGTLQMTNNLYSTIVLYEYTAPEDQIKNSLILIYSFSSSNLQKLNFSFSSRRDCLTQYGALISVKETKKKLNQTVSVCLSPLGCK